MSGPGTLMRRHRQGRTRRGAWFGIVGLALGCLAFGLTAPAAHAQDHSTRPIRIIVGAVPGGGLDIQVRIIGEALPKLLGQNVVIENRPGGGGVIAGQVVASAPPDGNTLFAYGGDLFSVATLMPPTAFNPNKQLVPIAQISETPLMVITGGHSGFSDVKGLIAAAKASPQGLTYATFSVASVNNVVGQWIAQEAHIKMLNITFRGGPEAALATAAGNVALAIVSPAGVYPSLVDAGSVKVIATTGARRAKYLPASWATLSESGLPIDASTFFGIFGPAGMSAAAVSRLDHALQAVLNDETVRQRLQQVGIFAQHQPSTEFAKRIETDRYRYDRVIQEMHMMDAQR